MQMRAEEPAGLGVGEGAVWPEHVSVGPIAISGLRTLPQPFVCLTQRDRERACFDLLRVLVCVRVCAACVLAGEDRGMATATVPVAVP